MIKKLVLLIITIAIIISTVLLFSVRRKKVFFPRENEIKVVNEDDIKEKIEQLSRQLETSPEDTNILVELGIYYFLRGHQYYDKSINCFYTAWKMGSTDIRIFYYLGCMYEFLKLYDLAIGEYKKFLRNVPNDEEVLIRLGNLYYQTKKVEDAIKIYEKVLSIDKNNIIALTNLGLVYYINRDVTNAIECFNKVLDISKKKNFVVPKNVNFYLGKIFFENKNYQTAKEYFEKEQKSYPDNLENTFLLVKTYYLLKEYENAYRLIQQISEFVPENREMVVIQRELKKMFKKG